MTLILSGTDGLSDIDGSAATPAVRGTDANTGIFFGADIIGFAEGGAEVARFNADAQFVAAAGTALLPVITTTGDVNTGIFFPAADTIAFTEGGAEAMRIDSSGRVGIGVTPSVASVKLTTVGGPVQLSPGTTSQEGIRLTRASGICQINGINNDNNAYNALTFATGASEAMRIDTSANLLFNSGYGSAAIAYGCRAWVNFNGTGTPAIRASGNVTSITDNGTGDYTVNFTTAMTDANYAYHIGSKQDSAGVGDVGFPTDGTPASATDGAAGMTTTRIRLRFTNVEATPALRDQEVACVSIFR